MQGGIMLESPYIYAVIFGMALVTYAGRELPFLILGGRKLNEKVVSWLSFVPVSVMSALVCQEIFINKSAGMPFIDLSFNNLFFWVGLATFVVGYFAKNFFITVVFGMAFLAALRYFFY